jgi:thiol-disulfide isomerase/thioredoxin
MKISKKSLLLVGVLVSSLVFLSSCWEGKKQNKEVKEGEVEIQNIVQEIEEAVEEAEKVAAEVAPIVEETTQEVVEEKAESEETVQEETVAEEPVVAAAGKYVEYTESEVANAAGNIVLFFHATWCPSCVSADKKISSEEIPSDLVVLKTDYDSNTDLRKKYGVTSQHTFVQVDSEGNLIKKWVWGRDVEDITERLQ